jgi:hypothetical protein
MSDVTDLLKQMKDKNDERIFNLKATIASNDDRVEPVKREIDALTKENEVINKALSVVDEYEATKTISDVPEVF